MSCRLGRTPLRSAKRSTMHGMPGRMHGTKSRAGQCVRYRVRVRNMMLKPYPRPSPTDAGAMSSQKSLKARHDVHDGYESGKDAFETGDDAYYQFKSR